ncbi:MAG TPA: dienelactone hydrolase family protein [Phycisphaerae bacterium]|nr:dienelactone hydrolase family protein [Phycisphaerae bacterium]
MSAAGIALTAALVAATQDQTGKPPVAPDSALSRPQAPVTTQPAAQGSITTQPLVYRDGDIELRGYLAYDKTSSGKRPGVLVVPEWWGLNDFAKEKARQIAALGYVALAVDMYGDGHVTSDPAEAGKLTGQFREDLPRWRKRIQAAYDALARDEHCDSKRIAAIGFCFGGSTVLQLAATGADVAAVVSFHGGLMPYAEADGARIKARILVLHGAADPHVPDESVKAFEDSLRKTNVDWQIIIYAGAKHGFMNPAAGRPGMEGVSYDERTARRAWSQMQAFLEEAFGATRP